MEVKFRARTYNDRIEIDGLMKEEHINVIKKIYEIKKQELDLSLLGLIIVPEDYKNELFEFQIKNGHSEYITENEYGRGLAQVVSSTNSNGEILYNIIIDKHLIYYLIFEQSLENLKEIKKDNDFINKFVNYRQSAINVLCHEFSHIHEFSTNRRITWMDNDDSKIDLQSQYIELAKQCWSEYFACRIASSTYPLTEEDCKELITTCKDTEKMLLEKRRRYNLLEISLQEFAVEFNSYVKFILKKIASAHGNLYCLSDSRNVIVEALEEGFGDALVRTIWSNFERELNILYEKYPNWEDNSVFSSLIDIFKIYLAEFEIFIYETDDGVYYDIPVRL